jgi:hypothetical protein
MQKSVEQDLDPGARERKFPGTISKDLIEEAVFGPLKVAKSNRIDTRLCPWAGRRMSDPT